MPDIGCRPRPDEPSLILLGRAMSLAMVVLLLAACGGPAPEVEARPDPPEQPVAEECDDVEKLAGLPAGLASRQPGSRSTGTEVAGGDGTAEGAPRGDEERLPLDRRVEQWVQQEAADSFAGIWVNELDGIPVLAFADDVERYRREVHDRFHPEITVLEAENSLAELRDVQARIDEEQANREDAEPGVVTSARVQVATNRVRVSIDDPSRERLAELSETYGASTICFEIPNVPEPLPDGLEALAKAEGWRGNLQQTVSAGTLIEIAYDRDTAERAWRENVPEGLEERRDALLPADPGLYGDLDQVDFDQQALIVWSAGESGSCPGWLANIDTIVGVVHTERGHVGGPQCTDDWAPYRMLLAIDRDRLPQPDDLPQDRIEPFRGGYVSTYPADVG